MSYRIPFNRPTLVGSEFSYIQQSIDGGKISGDGTYTQYCHTLLEESLGVHKALLTTSCTHALEMCAFLLNLKAGDEVILPSFTFVSTANAFVIRGAAPVFVDIRKDTLNFDETQLQAAITPRTRAIVVVHYGGVGCEMDEIMHIANHHNIPVIEDNAHGLFGRYRGQHLGRFGAFATQSFHETKNFQCGEGGALLINDPQYTERAEILREKGTNRSRFFRGEVDKYTWVDLGSSYLPSDMLAAFLYAQLEARAEIQSRRQQIWEQYHTRLMAWAQANQVTQPTVPPHCDQAYHLYYILLPSLDVRQALIDHLKARDILAVFHYLPLHTSDMGRAHGITVGDCAVTERVSDCLLRLPFYNSLSDADQDTVIEAILSFKVKG